MRILYIEDNPDDFLLVQRLLRQVVGGDWHLEERADRLSAGVQRLEQGGIDVVLLDLNLPDGRGAVLVAQLQRFAAPIVVITGTMLEQNEAIKAIREGAQEYLLKDQLTANGLERTIRYAVERKEIEQQLRKANETLQEQLRQIETMNRAMMDREDRILQLKDEIKQLKAQLPIREGTSDSS